MRRYLGEPVTINLVDYPDVVVNSLPGEKTVNVRNKLQHLLKAVSKWHYNCQSVIAWVGDCNG